MMRELFLANLPLFAVAVFVFLVARYALFAGLAFGLASVLSRRAPNLRIQPSPLPRGQKRREIAYSVMTCAIFTAMFLLVLALDGAGLTRIYRDIGDYGWAWFFLSIPIMLLVHDLYFYIAHRLIHVKPIFERVHRVHHLSLSPTPFAAFAFHPLEAIVEAGIFVVLVLLLPVHFGAFVIFFSISLLINVIGHLGYEIYPRWLVASLLGRWLNTATYHAMHHRTFQCNYGLYTVIWDRMFGTLSERSQDLLARLTARHATGG